ncbi:hypothetical protein ID866_11037 [Astraeus odoratus]|nr:hypothetical protein ID866_11037 [Astraeus odoratus]
MLRSELKAYYEASRYTDSPAVPTYLVSGEVESTKSGDPKPSSSTPDIYSMELDSDDEREGDVVYMSKVVLVDADVLDETMSQFSHIFSVHVYCLSPSKLKDAALICATNVNMRSKAAQIAGPAASSSINTLDEPKNQPAKVSPPPAPLQAKREPEQATKAKISTSEPKESTSVKQAAEKVETKEKSKPSGKLDWSKAKAKGKEKVVDKPKEDAKSKPSSSSKSSAAHAAGSSVQVGKSSEPATAKSNVRSTGHSIAPAQRGMKRKPQIVSDSEEEFSLQDNRGTSSSTTKVKNGAVLSEGDDDDDEIWVPRRRRAKGKGNVTSDTEKSLRAMMDIDDDQVVRASCLSKVSPKSDTEPEVEPELEEDKEGTVPPLSSDADEMDVDDEPIVKPKRKPKKVIPVGRNGLKKKRVVKTRTTTDAKGYMQAEDYSSYESVEEEDVRDEKPTKAKGKKKSGDRAEPEEKPVEKVTAKNKPKAAPSKAAPKPRGGAASKRGSLMNFFGPDRSKK